MLLADRPESPAPADPPQQALPERCETEAGAREAARDVRLFRARIAEALEAALERLLADVAAEVLGRELLLQPCEIDAIAGRALQRYAAEEPLRVRVHEDDVARVRCGVTAVADPELRRGDAVIELRDGCIDASLGIRLEYILRAAAP